MADLGNLAELEAELIKRNREIAKVRDDLLKTEKRLEESQMRNDDLLEKVSELDSEVSKKAGKINELEEKMTQLQVSMELKDAELGELRKEHDANIEKVRQETRDLHAERAKDMETHDGLKTHIEQMKAEADRFREEHAEEQRKHTNTKAALDTAETTHRDFANKALEQRRTIKELETRLQEAEDAASNMTASQAEALHEERARMAAELHRTTALLEEHKGVRDDVENQLREHHDSHFKVRNELEEAKQQIEEHSKLVATLEAARDEAVKAHTEHKANHEEIIQAQQKRHEEHLQKVSNQAASLDGRLSGQRMLLEETQLALEKSEAQEQKVAAELTAKLNELRSEHAAAVEEMASHKEKSSSDSSALESRYKQELETQETQLRLHAQTEINEAKRAQAEWEERHRRLEMQCDDHKASLDENQASNARQQESMRRQLADLRAKLNEVEEHKLNHAQEGERLQKEIESAKLEEERIAMNHRLEVDRLKQTLEAEAQSRNSAEKIAISKLEEKDTLIENRNAAIEKLEQDVEMHRKRIADAEASHDKTKEDGEARIHQVGKRVAQLEGELRNKHELVTQLESRLEAQRQVLEDLNQDRDMLKETKGSLEHQLRLEASHKDAVSASLQASQEEAERRNKELEERILRERETHKEAIEDIKQSVATELAQNAERLAAVEAELATARQRCELLARNKADLQQELASHEDKHARLEAGLSEHRATHEKLGLEHTQLQEIKERLEQELSGVHEERKSAVSRVEELTSEVANLEEQKSLQNSDFTAKVQKLDDLLRSERDLRQEAEANLVKHRQDWESRHSGHVADRRRVEQDLQLLADSWQEKAEEFERQSLQLKSEVEAQRVHSERLDAQRRETEQTLRADISTAEARARRVEVELQRAQTALEEGKAELHQQQATATAQLTALETQLKNERDEREKHSSSREAAEKAAEAQTAGVSQLNERVAMAAAELETRKVDFALEKQRLSGSLAESRRWASIGIPNAGGLDGVRVSGLETQLAEERKKSIEQSVALQRTERKLMLLEEQQRRLEEQRSDAVQQARSAERRSLLLSDDLRKAQIKQETTDMRCRENEELAGMSAAELDTVRFTAKYENARLRGALDELRYMIKAQSRSG